MEHLQDEIHATQIAETLRKECLAQKNEYGWQVMLRVGRRLQNEQMRLGKEMAGC